jgi:hypothetical protein
MHASKASSLMPPIAAIRRSAAIGSDVPHTAFSPAKLFQLVQQNIYV